ncbi:MAG TPA: crosslink repair DNA glycosylase YcaQ family protein, partial [Ktedonobacterales bacterium]|nr:crosslink repair DNA glycosylase YcaQ family protein [Ktedonobacterales bacterium]
AELWERRGLVKTYSLRGTLHIHRADELPLWTAARRAIADGRGERLCDSYGLEAAQCDAALAAMAEALDGRYLARQELAEQVAARVGAWAQSRLTSIWGDLVALGAEAGVVCFGPARGNHVTYARADQWIGGWRDIAPEVALATIFRTYFATYGPATYRDFAQWVAGNRLTGAAARQLLAPVAAELAEVTVEGKRAWLLASDVDTAWQPAPESVRLVPQYDCYVLGSRFGREVIVPPAAQTRIRAYKNGRFEGAVARPLLLLNGVVAGMWDRRPRGQRLEILVETFAPLSDSQQRMLAAEAARVGAFFGREASLTIGALA